MVSIDKSVSSGVFLEQDMTDNQMTTENKPDWSIEDLYRKSWNIVKNNKVLWIFAAAIGGGASFSNSFNFSNNDFEGFQKFLESNPPTPEPNTISQVLGTTTSPSLNTLSHLFSGVPYWLYGILALEILFLILSSIIISLVYSAWSNGALLENIEICIKGGKANIRDASEKAFGYIKPLIFIQIVPWLIGLLVMFGFLTLTIIAVIIGILISNIAIWLIFAFMSIPIMIFSLFAVIMLTLTLIWAPRMVVVDKKSGWAALVTGFNIAKRKFWASLLLGVVNIVLSMIVFFVPVAFIGASGIGSLFLGMSIEWFRAPLLVFWGLLMIPLLVLFMVGTAFFTAFKTTVWSLAYGNIRGKYE